MYLYKNKIPWLIVQRSFGLITKLIRESFSDYLYLPTVIKNFIFFEVGKETNDDNNTQMMCTKFIHPL